MGNFNILKYSNGISMLRLLCLLYSYASMFYDQSIVVSYDHVSLMLCTALLYSLPLLPLFRGSFFGSRTEF